MELTALFEQMSGSDEFKEEYDRLEKEKRRAEDDQIYSFQKKKGLAQARAATARAGFGGIVGWEERGVHPSDLHAASVHASFHVVCGRTGE